MVIDAVLFDWGGTLTPYHDIDIAVLWAAAAEVIAPDRLDELAAALTELEARSWSGTEDEMASFTTAQLLHSASQTLGIEVEEAVHELATSAYRSGWAPHLIARPEALDVLRAVKARGLRTGLLSNTHWPRDWHEDALADDGLLELLDARIYTSEIEHLKPHPAAFEAVLDAVGVAPERAVFVGDRLYDDIHGAKSLGMRAVWIKNTFVPGYEVEPDATIEELPELLDVLAAWIGA